MGDFYHEHGTPSFDFGRHFGFYFDTNHKPTFALDAFYKIYSYKTHKPQNPAESKFSYLVIERKADVNCL